MAQNALTISCCMMVRDAEETIGPALSSVLPYVDELCIIDTGSVDKTVAAIRMNAIASGHAGKLRLDERAWPDSYSEARNWTLELATQDAILILDADDYIAAPDKAFTQIRRQWHGDVAAFEFRIVSVIEEGGLSDIFWQTRLFRNDPSLRYEGIIHNQIDRNLYKYMHATGKRKERCPVDVMHSGYDLTLEGAREKYRRRLALYEKAVREADTPENQIYYGYQYAVGLYLAGYPEHAIRQMVHVPIDHLPADQEMHARVIVLKAMLMLMMHGKRLDEAFVRNWISEAVIKFPNPDIYITSAHLSITLGDLAAGLDYMLGAYDVATRHPRRQIDPMRIRKSLAEMMEHTGDTELAAVMLSDDLEAVNKALDTMRRIVTQLRAREMTLTPAVVPDTTEAA